MAVKLRALWLEAAGRRLAAIAGILMFGVLPVMRPVWRTFT